MKEVISKLEAYRAIKAVVQDHAFLFEKDYNSKLTSSDLQSMIDDLELSVKFGIELKYPGSNHLHKEVVNGYDNWCGIGLYGSEGMEISWPDSGTQPNNEWLYKLSFGCGAYIFTSGYPSDSNCPRETFKAFFEELKTYNPAFVDSANNALYFREDVAKVVHDEFPSIFKEYWDLVGAELKEKRRAELQRELESLK